MDSSKKSYAFLSHSSSDKPFVEKLAKGLGQQGVWFDKWELEAGNLLPQEVAQAVANSKWFVLIASKNSMASRWVRYELNLAIIHWLREEAKCNILVIRIDNYELHPELTPFLHIDCFQRVDEGIKEVLETLSQQSVDVAAKPVRARIVGRFEEIGAIEELWYERVKFIYLCGLYGIGKTTIVKRAAEEVFKMPLIELSMTSAHGALRLALELASKADLTLPPPTAKDEELTQFSAETVLKLNNQGYLICFDNIENILESGNGKLRTFLTSVFEIISDKTNLEFPILLCSTREPKLSGELHLCSHIMRVDRLKDKDILFCLENWIRLSQPGQPLPDRSKLEKLAPQLYGYPFAAKLAAHYVIRYSVDTLLNDLKYFKEIRIDIANQLLGRLRTTASFPNRAEECLEALAIVDSGLSLSELASIFSIDPNELRGDIDYIVSALVVFWEPDSNRLQIHPIVKEYFWHRVYESGKLKTLSKLLATDIEKRLAQVDEQTQEFVHLSTKLYRMLTYCGEWSRARNLKYDFREELREASRRLYQNGDLKEALSYMDAWLLIDDQDYDIQWFKARCLTRLNRYDLAEAELDDLESKGYRLFKIYHAKGLIRRYQGKYEEAVIFYRKGLEDFPINTPLLRDLGDALDRLDDTDGALKVLTYAYDLAPRDPYIVSKYVDILSRKGREEEALEVINIALLAFPDEAAFNHRKSTILEKLGQNHEALIFSRKAIKIGGKKLPEAVLQCASLEAKAENFDEAERLLQELPIDHFSRSYKLVRDTLEAHIKWKRRDVEAARVLLNAYKQDEIINNSYCSYVLANLELEDSQQAFLKNKALGQDRLNRAKAIVNAALKRFPDNSYLKQTQQQVLRVESELFG